MNLKEVKKYVSDTIEGYFKPKVLKKFDEDTNGNLTYDGDLISANTKVSGKLDNAIEVISDTVTPANDGLYVKDISNEVNKINIAQKTINENVGYIQVGCSDYSTALALGSVFKFPYIRDSHNDIDYNPTTGTFKLKAHKTYSLEAQITMFETYGYFYYIFKDITKNKEIGTGGKTEFNTSRSYHDDKGNAASAVYTPDIDTEVQVVVNSTSTGNFKIQGVSYIKITEIGRDIVIDPINYLDTKQGIQDTPVGHIMSIMGNNAPEHYLKCDGTVYNKDDYPYLWEYFKNEFGTPNKFGGNGTTTFAVPDLRDEFLRGTGTLSGNVGEHQEGTIIPNIGINYDNSDMAVRASKSVGMANVEDVKKSGTLTYNNVKITKSATSGQTWEEGTVRPRNTSVLWVIKYEPTYFVGSINGKEERTELLNNYIDIKSTTHENKSYTIDKSINDYDYIEINIAGRISDGNNPDVDWNKSVIRIPISDITYHIINNGDTWSNCYTKRITWSRVTLALNFGFTSDTQLYIGSVIENKDSSVTTIYFPNTYYFRINSITGIKTIYAPDKAISGGTTTVEPEPTDADIQTAITETITELNK